MTVARVGAGKDGDRESGCYGRVLKTTNISPRIPQRRDGIRMSWFFFVVCSFHMMVSKWVRFRGWFLFQDVFLVWGPYTCCEPFFGLVLCSL